ncbi:MAG: glycoside hydrolase family 2 TIM barrel-domain containing protein [Bacteroidales bacterium]
MKRSIFFILIIFMSFSAFAETEYKPEFSTAGFFKLHGSGRDIYSMNPAWRFHKGALSDAQARDYNDRGWSVVSLPNGIEYLPTEASGCINYQGEVWYRKHFIPSDTLKGKKLFLHFEAIMGKSKVFVNGKSVAKSFGGYLPIVADITDVVEFGKDNIIAVWADNSNDPSYPPGKAQDVLDFAYFGGIYRDCWLIACNDIYITDPNYEKEVAGGGLFVAYDKVSEASAEMLLQLHLRNDGQKLFSGTVWYEVLQPDGKRVALSHEKFKVDAEKSVTVKDKILLKAPQLWSPESPFLYNLIVRVRDKDGRVVDGYRLRVGVRSVEFKGKDGFWLNGKAYNAPLIGANRHQDFAVVGNAVANSIHWRDAKKLRDAGLKVVRNAHCPQDPAFMDACDELGLFVIVNTPGWQFWNDAPEFAERCYTDIRNIVRRDRNHPCIWLWEPVLNETWYPEEFAKHTKNIVEEEYPYPYSYSACDASARGKEYFSILFTHPLNGEEGGYNLGELNPKITYFTREWGDNVDDWNSHNSPSRVARNWGEQPMLVQAKHYADPEYISTSYDALCRTPNQHVGGCLWHSFDHQRGYHPDPFYGGIMDVFRQPKYSYYMFMSQRSPQKEDRIFETGPMVYIAHEMTPFSNKDVTVFSNCDQVRLVFNKGGESHIYTKDNTKKGMPSPIITFKDVYNFMTDKALSNDNKQDDIYLFAEGLINGKVVATHKVSPARRPEKILLSIDDEKTGLKADGSDFVTVVASVTDKNGNIKRLNNYYIKFSIEGEGRILGGAGVMANPAPIRWGVAPILVQSTLKPGKIKISASVLFEGSQMPVSGVLEFESRPAVMPLVYDSVEASLISDVSRAGVIVAKTDKELEIEISQKEENARKLKEVEKQQADFGENK